MKDEPKIEKEENNSYYIVKQKRGINYDKCEEDEGSYAEARRKGIPLTREKYSPETKIIVARFAKNHIARLAADKYGIPVGTIRRWLSRFNRLGRAAFGDIESVDIGSGDLSNKLKYEKLKSEKSNAPEYIKSECVKYEKSKSYKSENMATSSEISSVTKSHIRLNTNNSKLPKVEGWEKVNLISPSLRLWSAKEGMKNGCKKTAASIGVADSTLQRWMSAYRTKGEEAHIFKTNVKYYSGSDNKGRGSGVCIFSLQYKKDIIDRAVKENNSKVAFEVGISPDTITKWKKKLNYPIVKEEGEIPVPDWYKSSKRKRAQEYSIVERCAGGRWEFDEGVSEVPPLPMGGENIYSEIDGIYLD